MKRKTVFVLFVVPEVGSVGIKRQETHTRGVFSRVPKSKVIRTAGVRAIPEPRVGNLNGENRQ
jgi:hypothetical protein